MITIKNKRFDLYWNEIKEGDVIDCYFEPMGSEVRRLLVGRSLRRELVMVDAKGNELSFDDPMVSYVVLRRFEQ